MREPSRGILNPSVGATKFQLSRHLPSSDIGAFVERYWIVKWDLRGQPPYLSETLPYPCVNLVFERDRTAIYGVVTGRFGRLLEAQGRVLGVKFKPGGFFPFMRTPMSALTDRSVRFQEALGVDDKAIEAAILAQTDDWTMIELAEKFLRAQLPEPDEMVGRINEIVDRINADRSITKVEHLVRQFNLSSRTLQRMFNQYVGVSPKWVIKRARLQEAAEQLANNQEVDWPNLALDLGYFDQAHFINEFKTIIGRKPIQYAKSA